MPPQRQAIVADHVTIEYPIAGGRTFTAVQDLSLSTGPQEFISIIGRSGCGKSTLLKAIAGLIKTSAGTIEVNGQLVDQVPTDTTMMFQSPVLLEWLTIEDNVAFPLRVAGANKREAREEARQYLDLAGLSGFAKYHPRQLSGGMQQRASLCRALIQKPKIMLMDEPFASLDEFTRIEMGRHVELMWKHCEAAVVLVTHSIAEAIGLGDRVLVMNYPGYISREIAVPFERPRSLAMQRSREFVDMVSELQADLGLEDDAVAV